MQFQDLWTKICSLGPVISLYTVDLVSPKQCICAFCDSIAFEFTDSNRVANDVLTAVQTALTNHSGSSVTLVGHSLGAAIALIDAVYLPLHLDSSTTFKYVGYGLPRVGNQAFASYLDTKFLDLTHINNKEDPAPIVPGMLLVSFGDANILLLCDGQKVAFWASCSRTVRFIFRYFLHIFS